jgi:hypothetical protein
MGYEPETAARVRRLLSDRSDVVEKTIVGGGLGFMVGGKLCCAVTSRGLTVRLGATAKTHALREPYVVPHMVGKRETKAFVVVETDGYSQDEALAAWVRRGLDYVATLP